MKSEHTPTPLDVFDSRLTELRELYSDSLDTYAMVVRAICAHEELLAACKFVADKLSDPALVTVLDQAIAKAEGK